MKWERVADEVDDQLRFADDVVDLAMHLVHVHGYPPFTNAAASACAAWARGVSYCEPCGVRGVEV